VACGGYKFEVIDVDSYRIDQVMVTRIPEGTAAASTQTA
jgi:CBS domain containing-hemolysin-like protein